MCERFTSLHFNSAFCQNQQFATHTLTKGATPLGAPQIIQTAKGSTDQLVLENYDDKNYGYLRIIVNSVQLRIEYHLRATVRGPRRRTIS